MGYMGTLDSPPLSSSSFAPCLLSQDESLPELANLFCLLAILVILQLLLFKQQNAYYMLFFHSGSGRVRLAQRGINTVAFKLQAKQGKINLAPPYMFVD